MPIVTLNALVSILDYWHVLSFSFLCTEL
jgi:hypothetical protein